MARSSEKRSQNQNCKLKMFKNIGDILRCRSIDSRWICSEMLCYGDLAVYVGDSRQASIISQVQSSFVIVSCLETRSGCCHRV